MNIILTASETSMVFQLANEPEKWDHMNKYTSNMANDNMVRGQERHISAWFKEV